MGQNSGSPRGTTKKGTVDGKSVSSNDEPVTEVNSFVGDDSGTGSQKIAGSDANKSPDTIRQEKWANSPAGKAAAAKDAKKHSGVLYGNPPATTIDALHKKGAQ